MLDKVVHCVALLFILCVEILACKIRKNPSIKGFNLAFNGKSTIFLENKDQIPKVLLEPNDFEKVAGLVLNKTQTNAMLLVSEQECVLNIGEINITN